VPDNDVNGIVHHRWCLDPQLGLQQHRWPCHCRQT
jgi:hypothetical protein